MRSAGKNFAHKLAKCQASVVSVILIWKWLFCFTFFQRHCWSRSVKIKMLVNYRHSFHLSRPAWWMRHLIEINQHIEWKSQQRMLFYNTTPSSEQLLCRTLLTHRWRKSLPLSNYRLWRQIPFFHAFLLTLSAASILRGLLERSPRCYYHV